jgi:hypothetical protein
LSPTGALAAVPTGGRLAAISAGVAAMLAMNRSLMAGLVVGELTLLAATYLSKA